MEINLRSDDSYTVEENSLQLWCSLLPMYRTRNLHPVVTNNCFVLSR